MNSHIKLYVIIAAFFSLVSVLLHAEEWKTSEVKEITISEAEWTQPKDGSKPEIISWNLKVSLDNGQELFTSSKEQNPKTDIYAFFNRGDRITLLKESYFLNEANQSWFHVNNQTTNQESVLKGPSRQEKPDLGDYEDIFYIKHPILSQENGNWFLSFHIKDIYTTIEVDSEKFHDFYEGLPLKYMGVSDEEEYNVIGKRRSTLYFYHPIKDEQIALNSNWRGGPQSLTIDKVDTIQHSWGWSGAIKYWDYIITLSDGTELLFEAAPKTYENSGLFQKNDTLYFMNEMVSKNSEEFKRFKGSFLIFNSRTGLNHYLKGTVRWLDEFKAWDPLTIAKSNTVDKVWAGDYIYDQQLRTNIILLLQWKTSIELTDGRRFFFNGNPDIEKLWKIENQWPQPWTPNPNSIFMKDDAIHIMEIVDQKYCIRNSRSGKEYWFFAIP